MTLKSDFMIGSPLAVPLFPACESRPPPPLPVAGSPLSPRLLLVQGSLVRLAGGGGYGTRQGILLPAGLASA